MDIIIETPRYSFFKHAKTSGGFRKEFFSLVPCIYNYGFIEGTNSEDGMEEDAIVLGPRIDQGTRIKDARMIGVVRFVDDSRNDDKKVFSLSGEDSIPSTMGLYFRIYSVYKMLMYLFLDRSFKRCKFDGIERSYR